MKQTDTPATAGIRRADLGNGKFLNPIIAGDHPDPTILKDGDDYYMTFSSFLSYPGIVIWHSRDLVNWEPIHAALRKSVGSVWALDLVKHEGRYFIYIPAMGDSGSSIHVIHADNIRGPWSDPIDLKLPGCIDPGHAVGEDGKRYLFVNGIRRVALSDDGLSAVGEPEHAYSPWCYPPDWVVEMFAPEGPKIFRRGKYFYLVSAVGGTAGPATSHMVIMARSESIKGPWVDCPRNPLVHTESEEEPWWSRGHASLVEGPDGSWWMVYHGYENGYRSLGRQTLMEPVRWTRDGWIEPLGGDLSKPMKIPAPRKPDRAGQAGQAQAGSTPLFDLSDDFSTDKRGVQWSFCNPGPGEDRRLSHGDKRIILEGKGSGPESSSPLVFTNGDRAFEMAVTLDVSGGAVGGLLLYYSERMYCGIGFSAGELRTWHYGQEHSWMRQKMPAGTKSIKLSCVKQVATFHYMTDGKTWIRHPWQMEVSGMNHNVFGGFTSLKPALLSAGEGAVAFSDFRYRGEGGFPPDILKPGFRLSP